MVEQEAVRDAADIRTREIAAVDHGDHIRTATALEHRFGFGFVGILALVGDDDELVAAVLLLQLTDVWDARQARWAIDAPVLDQHDAPLEVSGIELWSVHMRTGPDSFQRHSGLGGTSDQAKGGEGEQALG